MASMVARSIINPLPWPRRRLWQGPPQPPARRSPRLRRHDQELSESGQEEQQDDSEHEDEPAVGPRAHCRLNSVPRLIHQRLLLDPRHHAAQALADLLDRVLGELGARRLERGLVDAVLEHPVAGELARLDVGQHPLHLGLGLGRDDARAGDVLAVLGGVRDRVVHVGDAALVDEVDDQLDLVQALEIGHLGRVAGLDEGLVAGLDELDEAAAEHGLLAEEVGLALLLEARLDDPGAPPSLSLCSMWRARPPPIAEPYDSPRSWALPEASLWIASRQGTPPPRWYSERTVWPGPFGAIISTSMSGRGSIRLKCTLRPCANISAAPFLMLP